jgi:hypothetical protein
VRVTVKVTIEQLLWRVNKAYGSASLLTSGMLSAKLSIDAIDDASFGLLLRVLFQRRDGRALCM